MKTPLTAIALALSILTGSLIAAAAEEAARESSFHTRVQERYCEKLREGVSPFVHFVQRMAPIHAYTYTDFAPAYPGAPVVADCRASEQRVAEVRKYLQLAEKSDR